MENESGFLTVGHNEQGQVVVNLPHDMTGHIVFSPLEAAQFADILKLRATQIYAGLREPVSLEEIRELRDTAVWALEIITMYDEFLISKGEPVDKVLSLTHVAGVAKAKRIIEATKGRDFRNGYDSTTAKHGA